MEIEQVGLSFDGDAMFPALVYIFDRRVSPAWSLLLVEFDGFSLVTRLHLLEQENEDMDTVFQSSLEWLSCAAGSVMKFSRFLHFSVGGRGLVSCC